jgi:hypothetical protein
MINFFLGLLVGAIAIAIIDLITFMFIVLRPRLMRKIVSRSPKLLDKWEGEFDTGYYGPIDEK